MIYSTFVKNVCKLTVYLFFFNFSRRVQFPAALRFFWQNSGDFALRVTKLRLIFVQHKSLLLDFLIRHLVFRTV
jgi:hypothetical protein